MQKTFDVIIDTSYFKESSKKWFFRIIVDKVIVHTKIQNKKMCKGNYTISKEEYKYFFKEIKNTERDSDGIFFCYGLLAQNTIVVRITSKGNNIPWASLAVDTLPCISLSVICLPFVPHWRLNDSSPFKDLLSWGSSTARGSVRIESVLSQQLVSFENSLVSAHMGVFFI